MFYEWDESKRLINLGKHGYDFREAWKIFESSVKVTFDSHRPTEKRWNDLSEIDGTLIVLTLTYTVRGEAVRIISMRKASRKERSLFYGQNS